LEPVFVETGSSGCGLLEDGRKKKMGNSLTKIHKSGKEIHKSAKEIHISFPDLCISSREICISSRELGRLPIELGMARSLPMIALSFLCGWKRRSSNAYLAFTNGFVAVGRQALLVLEG